MFNIQQIPLENYSIYYKSYIIYSNISLIGLLIVFLSLVLFKVLSSNNLFILFIFILFTLNLLISLCLYFAGYKDIITENKIYQEYTQTVFDVIINIYNEISNKPTDLTDISNEEKILNFIMEEEVLKNKKLLPTSEHKEQLKALQETSLKVINLQPLSLPDHKEIALNYMIQLYNKKKTEEESLSLQKELTKRMDLYYFLINQQEPPSQIKYTNLINLDYCIYNMEEQGIYINNARYSIKNYFVQETYQDIIQENLHIKYMKSLNYHYVSLKPVKYDKTFLLEINLDDLKVHKIFIKFQDKIYEYSLEKETMFLKEKHDYNSWFLMKVIL